MLSTRFLLLAPAIVILVKSSDVSVVKKCCLPGQVFVAENLTCADATPRENFHEIYSINDNKGNWGYEGLLNCQNSTITSFDRINSSNIHGSACIDFFYGQLDTPFIFLCPNATAPVADPRLIGFRTCCSPGKVYDIHLRDCINGSSENVVNEIQVFMRQTDFASVVRGTLECADHAIVDYVVNMTEDIRLSEDGVFQMLTHMGDNQHHQASAVNLTEKNSCIDVGPSSAAGQLIVRLCKNTSFCESNACIRKCCPEGTAWTESGCTEYEQTDAGQLHHEIMKYVEEKAQNSSMPTLNTTNYGLLIGKQYCEHGMYPILPQENWYINSLGHVHLSADNIFQHHAYCMEMLYNIEGYEDGLYPCVCFGRPTPAVSETRFRVNAALELISCTFLLITFLVYLCLPLLQNLHGKTLMCHVASLFIAYLCLATVALVTPPDGYNAGTETDSRLLCKSLGYTTLFALLACFSWLNVMCIDIWWTFGGIEGVTNIGGRRNAQRKRFLIYSLYAWGFPLLVTSFAIAVDHTGILAKHLRPNMAINSCWFEQHWSYQGDMIYFIGPIAIQLLINIILFIMTSRYCSRVRDEITRFMSTDTDIKSRQFRADKTKLIMIIKLFVVMGVTWVLDIVSYILNHYETNFKWRTELFYVSDAVNCLQGLLIFILFVLKTKVYYALMHRLGRRKPNPPSSLGASSLQDPYRVKKSASCSTLMSTFGPVSSTP